MGICIILGLLYIIIEYVLGGNLFDYLWVSCLDDEIYVNIIFILSLCDLFKIVLDCVCGMYYIVEKKFVYCDFVVRNIFFMDEYEVKVVDFGLV